MLFSCLFTITILFPAILNSRELTNCESTYIPISSDTVICPNNCTTCNVQCTTSGQCTKVRIFSSAIDTIINCTGANSCQDTFMYLGDTPFLPSTEYQLSNFRRESYNSIEIICLGDVSCAKASVIVHGSYNNGGYLNANGTLNKDHFKDALLDITMSPDSIFNINCGESNLNCGGNTRYTCYGGICQCNGVYNNGTGGCSAMTFTVNTPSPSFSPTTSATPTAVPSQLPSFTPSSQTISPTVIPSALPTTLPTIYPSVLPTLNPTSIPTILPTTNKPTNLPSIIPTKLPSVTPVFNPTTFPSIIPTNIPTTDTTAPTTTSPPSNTPTIDTTTPTTTTTTTIAPIITTAAPIITTAAPIITTINDNTNNSTTLTTKVIITPTNEEQKVGYKPGYKAAIIVSTSVAAIALVIVGIYYLLMSHRKKTRK